MLFKIVLERTVVQSTYLEVEAEDFNAAVIDANRRHREGLEWDDESVEYGVHAVQSANGYQEFSFDEEE
jgi:hypothetical protein